MALPPPVEDPNSPEPTTPPPLRSLTDEQWEEQKRARGLLTTWRVALADALANAVAAHPDDLDAAAVTAAEFAAPQLPDALDDAAEVLDDVAFDRIARRMDIESRRRERIPDRRTS